MTVFVLDTNIISFYLRNQGAISENIVNALLNGDDVLIAPIAYYEIKRGLMAINSQKRMNEFDNLCELLGVGQLDNNILNVAAEIYTEQRKKGLMMEDADIFIAAFCKYHNFTLITNNTKHFKNISNLMVLDWL
jgi:predicted nucleic acid-binding protein